jgi:hypothetical protein
MVPLHEGVLIGQGEGARRRCIVRRLMNRLALLLASLRLRGLDGRKNRKELRRAFIAGLTIRTSRPHRFRIRAASARGRGTPVDSRTPPPVARTGTRFKTSNLRLVVLGLVVLLLVVVSSLAHGVIGTAQRGGSRRDPSAPVLVSTADRTSVARSPFLEDVLMTVL